MIRVAVAALADAVNVRENMLNVLSAGISSVRVDSFPATVRLDVALMLEVSGADLADGGSRGIHFGIGHAETDSMVMQGEGTVGWQASDAPSVYIPMPLEVHGIEFERAGQYRVVLAIEGLDPIQIPLVISENDAIP